MYEKMYVCIKKMYVCMYVDKNVYKYEKMYVCLYVYM